MNHFLKTAVLSATFAGSLVLAQTKDAVIDNRGPEDTHFFKKYAAGLDGVHLSLSRITFIERVDIRKAIDG